MSYSIICDIPSYMHIYIYLRASAEGKGEATTKQALGQTDSTSPLVLALLHCTELLQSLLPGRASLNQRGFQCLQLLLTYMTTSISIRSAPVSASLFD